jgi:hypothetical protein
MNNSFQNISLSRNPYLLIVAGPAGAGKGNMPSFIAEHLSLANEHKKILIDDLVTKNPFYKKEYNEWVKKNNYTVEKIKQEILSPSKETLDMFSNAYIAARSCTNCETGEFIPNCVPNINNAPPGSCNYTNDEMLLASFKEGRNIVLETTGLTFPHWIFSKKLPFVEYLQNYQIICTYTIVDMCKLLERNKSRANAQVEKYAEQMKLFANDLSKLPDAPRLPNIDINVYRKTIESIVAQLILFVETQKTKCEEQTEYCKIRVILVDNNDKPNVVVHDSNNPEQFRDILKMYNSSSNCR